MKNLECEIYELECQHISPDIRVSGAKLGKILDDDFYEFGSSGGVSFRSEYVGGNVLESDRMEIHDFNIHLLGEAAVLTTYRIENKSTERNTNRSSIWKKRENGWKLFFHQGTVTKR